MLTYGPKMAAIVAIAMFSSNLANVPSAASGDLPIHCLDATSLLPGNYWKTTCAAAVCTGHGLCWTDQLIGGLYTCKCL
jgi:hypothetical protein